MGIDWRQERIARNESSFRAINERLERGLQQLPHSPDLHEFVCECGSRECTEMVTLTFDEYEAARVDPHYFVVRPGHVFPKVERIVEQHERFFLLEKIGESRKIVEGGDPRADAG